MSKPKAAAKNGAPAADGEAPLSPKMKLLAAAKKVAAVSSVKKAMDPNAASSKKNASMAKSAAAATEKTSATQRDPLLAAMAMPAKNEADKQARVDEVASVLKSGVDPNKEVTPMWPPLRRAARMGDAALCELLLSYNADIEAYNHICLLTAASWGFVDVVELLLRESRLEGTLHVHDSERIDAGEDTPLMWAARQGNKDVVRCLLRARADVNAGIDTANGQKRCPLSLAWHNNRLAVVDMLVQEGAQLQLDDWIRAAVSPAVCLSIAEGLKFRRHGQRSRYADDNAEGVQLTGDRNIRTFVPLTALCSWIRSAPEAAAALFSGVLRRDPTGRPQRAEWDFDGPKVRSAYIPGLYEWDRKNEALADLCPREQQSGSNIELSVIDVDGLLCSEVLYALTRAEGNASSVLFEEESIVSMLEYTWENFVRSRYSQSLVREVLLVLSLIWWSVTLPNSPDYVIYLSLAILTLTLIFEAWGEVMQMAFLSKAEGSWTVYFNDLGNAVAWARLVACFTLLPAALLDDKNATERISVFRDLQDVVEDVRALREANGTGVVLSEDLTREEVELYLPSYAPSMAIVVFFRWLQVLFALRGFHLFGPRILPILLSLRDIGPFTLVLFIQLAAFIHATYALNPSTPSMTAVIRQYEQLFGEIGGRFDELPEKFAGWQIFWFTLGTFSLGIVMLNVFVGIMGEAYDRQQDNCRVSFTQTRAQICFSTVKQIRKHRADELRREALERRVATLSLSERLEFNWLKFKAALPSSVSNAYDSVYPAVPQAGYFWIIKRAVEGTGGEPDDDGDNWDGRIGTIKISNQRSVEARVLQCSKWIRRTHTMVDTNVRSISGKMEYLLNCVQDNGLVTQSNAPAFRIGNVSGASDIHSASESSLSDETSSESDSESSSSGSSSSS